VAFDSLPPWIAGITPNLFSQALQAGARVGLELTDQSIRAQAMAQAQMDRQAAAQERAERAAERQREFEASRLLDVQRLGQQVKHQAAIEANQTAQESRLLDYQQGLLGIRQQEADQAAQPVAPSLVDLGGGAKGVVMGKSYHPLSPSASATRHELGEVIPVVDKTTETLLGNVITTGPNTGRFEKAEGITLTAPQQVQVERARMSVINAELQNVDRLGMKEDEQNEFIKSRMEALQDVNSKLLNLSKGRPRIGGNKSLTREQAMDFFQRAGGDKDKARQMARDAGFDF